MDRNPACQLTIEPVTRDRWTDFAHLFGERGACGGCWCMLWRQTRAEHENGKGAGNRRAMKRIIDSDRIPGVIAYRGHEPVAWCSIAPRSEFSALTRSRVLKPIDDEPVWSVSCFFVTRPFRRQGIGAEILRGACAYAFSWGAEIVEGYPVIPRQGAMPDAFAWTGVPEVFLRAGFQEAHRWSESRPIMRAHAPRRRKPKS